MQRHRVYTGQPLQPGAAVILEESPARHLTQVLRLKPGAEITLFNGDGHDYSARLDEVSRRVTSAMVDQRLEPAEAPAPLQIHLPSAFPRASAWILPSRRRSSWGLPTSPR